MNTPDTMTQPGLDKDEHAKDAKARSNRRLGLILGAVALILFFGFILLSWLPGR